MISFLQNRAQRYYFLCIWPNKLHKINQFVHTLADLCNPKVELTTCLRQSCSLAVKRRKMACRSLAARLS